MNRGREPSLSQEATVQNMDRNNMIGQGSFEDADAKDFCGDFFDHIDDLLDFPNEDVDGGEIGDMGGSWRADANPPPPSVASSHSCGGSSSHRSVEEDLAPLAVPSEELAELEWLSTFMDDSFPAGCLDLDYDRSHDAEKKLDFAQVIGSSHHVPVEADVGQNQSHFQTSSPISVLESSSSCSDRLTLLSPDTVAPARARSKRTRPVSFSGRIVTLPVVSPASSDATSELFSAVLSEESHPPPLLPQKKMLKKKKRQLAPPPEMPSGDDGEAAHQPAASARKCLHCGIQKTPQWRMGPMGPKTLCNACGVRYKSGRLYPEYRPAASPTFVPTVHSNSHKKVLEMRVKTGTNTPAPTPEFVRKNSVQLLDCA